MQKDDLRKIRQVTVCANVRALQLTMQQQNLAYVASLQFLLCNEKNLVLENAMK